MEVVVNINKRLKHIIKCTLACFDDLSWLVTKDPFMRFLPPLITCALWLLCVIEWDYYFHPELVRYFPTINGIIFFQSLPVQCLCSSRDVNMFHDKWGIICSDEEKWCEVDHCRGRFYMRVWLRRELIIHSLGHSKAWNRFIQTNLSHFSSSIQIDFNFMSHSR